MQIRIKPSRSEIWNIPDNILDSLLAKFSYTNKSVSYQFSRHLKGKFGIIGKLRATQYMTEQDAYEEWQRQLDQLNKQKHVQMITMKANGVAVFPTGLLERVNNFFKEAIQGYNEQQTLVDLRKKPKQTHGFVITATRPTLYPFQQKALDAALEKGQGTIVSGTGTGKTVIIQELLQRLGLNAIVVVPNLSILDQTVKRFEKYFGRNKVGILGGSKKKVRTITLACAPTLAKMEAEDLKDVDVLIWDECHHTPAATLEKIAYEVLPNAYYRFGFTATNYRTDGADLAIEAAAFPAIFNYDIQQGIADGVLAEPTFFMFRVPFSSSRYSGDNPTFAYKNHILRNTKFNETVKNHIQKFVATGSKVLVLVKEKTHGHYFQQFIPNSLFVRTKDSKEDTKDLSYVAPYVDPTDAVIAFNKGLVPCLIGTSIIGEGTDILPVDTVFLLTGGSSKVTVMQNIGRGLRRCEGKTKVTIIDYIYSSHEMLEKHSIGRYNMYKKIGKVHTLELK